MPMMTEWQRNKHAVKIEEDALNAAGVEERRPFHYSTRIMKDPSGQLRAVFVVHTRQPSIDGSEPESYDTIVNIPEPHELRLRNHFIDRCRNHFLSLFAAEPLSLVGMTPERSRVTIEVNSREHHFRDSMAHQSVYTQTLLTIGDLVETAPGEYRVSPSSPIQGSIEAGIRSDGKFEPYLPNSSRRARLTRLIPGTTGERLSGLDRHLSSLLETTQRVASGFIIEFSDGINITASAAIREARSDVQRAMSTLKNGYGNSIRTVSTPGLAHSQLAHIDYALVNLNEAVELLNDVAAVKNISGDVSRSAYYARNILVGDPAVTGDKGLIGDFESARAALVNPIREAASSVTQYPNGDFRIILATGLNEGKDEWMRKRDALQAHLGENFGYDIAGLETRGNSITVALNPRADNPLRELLSEQLVARSNGPLRDLLTHQIIPQDHVTGLTIVRNARLGSEVIQGLKALNDAAAETVTAFVQAGASPAKGFETLREQIAATCGLADPQAVTASLHTANATIDTLLAQTSESGIGELLAGLKHRIQGNPRIAGDTGLIGALAERSAAPAR